MTIATRTPLQDRVLVLMPSPRDIERAVQVLAEASVASAPSWTIEELVDDLRAGAGALLVTDEILMADACRPIGEVLREQPAWSSLPVLVLAREGTGERIQNRILDGHGNVVVLERPVRTRSLVSAVQSALRARRTQYQIRDALQDRERQATAILAQDEKLRFVLAAGRLGAWEIAPAEGELVCSDISKEIYGRPLDRPFTFAELRECIPPQDRPHVFGALAACVETGSVYDVEHRVVWPNGETHWVLSRGRATHDQATSVTRVVGVSLDVTERERLHQQLRASRAELSDQAEQLRAADRLKDEFLATLAHELRNPLAPISTGLSLLIDPSTSKEISLKTLGVMERQVKHMVRLIDDLLDVSRITRGKLDLKREPVAVKAILDAAVEGSMPKLVRGGHRLVRRCTEEPLVVDADLTRAAQIVSNLLDNASKYTPSGGVVELSSRRDGGQVVIAVKDNGLGIPAEHLDDIFAMFGQVNRALDRSQGGLGIGLALVRKLVEMHGGTVLAESPGRGQGSVFTVRLPLTQGAPAAVHPAAPELRHESAHKQVLLVDDNSDAVELLAVMLEQVGYTTTAVQDGQAAITAAHTLTPDVVILDIGLPGMSGYEVAEALRRDPALTDTALIALTGWGTVEDRRRAFAAGFDLHLTKPVTPEDLELALGRATRLRGRNPSAAAAR